MSFHIRIKLYLNHTNSIEIKSDFCLTNAQRRERKKGKREIFVSALY